MKVANPTSPEAEAASRSAVEKPIAASRPSGQRAFPSRGQAVTTLALADLKAIWDSWLSRGFLLASASVTVLELKGMQANQQVASQMLEAVYVTYLLIWMHGVIFIAGAAFLREQDCLNEAILSRGVTRGEYLSGKLLARCGAIFLMIGCVLVPGSFWAIRQDKLVRTESGYVASHAKNTKVEAWDPKKIFAGTDGTATEMSIEVGDSVGAGDVLATFDDRKLFDELETERRAEENARNEVLNAQRRYEIAKRAASQGEDALARAERALIAKDLLSKMEQADRASDIRSRKRDLKDAENQLRIAADAITTAKRSVANTQARVRDARKRLQYATVLAPISGYVTEVDLQAGQYVGLGTHIFTIAPLDEFRLDVPIYHFSDFKRLKPGLPAYITIQGTEFTGAIDRVGATTKPDRWSRESNYVVVRFKGDGTPGLLGLDADVRLVLPPVEKQESRASALLNTLTGHGVDDLESQTASVTPRWMLIALAKVVGCAFFLINLTLFMLAVSRSALFAILGAAGLWHISNLFFDFAGLPRLSYLEMVRTMDKVLGGIASPVEELTTLAWLFGLATVLGVLAWTVFVARDPQK